MCLIAAQDDACALFSPRIAPGRALTRAAHGTFRTADDHVALGGLCTDAVTHQASVNATRLRHRNNAGGYVPTDCRACFDGEFIYLVRRAAAGGVARRAACGSATSAHDTHCMRCVFVVACSVLMRARVHARALPQRAGHAGRVGGDTL
jgi:hypothetical protein